MLKNTNWKFNSIKIINCLLLVLILIQSNLLMAEDSIWFDENIHQTDRILVKLVDDSLVEIQSAKLIYAGNDQNTLLQVNKLNTSSEQWTTVFDNSKETLKNWRTDAVQKSNQSFADLSQFFYVHISDQVDIKQRIEELRASSLVEGAYPVAKPTEPPLPPSYEYSDDENSDPTYGNVYQRYFNAAPEGLDIHYAREGIGGRGNGVTVCDVEYGWKIHNDQPQITNLKLPDFDFPDAFYDHGTAVLGMLGSKDNGWGTTGLITDSEFLFSPSRPFNQSFNIANAISTCMSQIDVGDVILIEQQMQGRNGQFVPVEWDPAVHSTIKLATTIGYVVVEAAGNGGEDLDHVFYSTAQPGFAPFTAANDSGAIIVGAADSPWTATPLERSDTSTYGDTVDLHAWGRDLIAPGYGNYYDDEGDALSYILFSGTSGASPMITAAVAIIQANYIAKNGSPATPDSIKQLLIDTGTAQANVSGENIGPMPDLRNAINTLWQVDDVDSPVITPASGTYQMPLQVTIDYAPGDNSTNTHIRYTLDGSEPTVDSYVFLPDQGDSIYLNYGLNVKAKSFKNNSSAGRLFASETASSIFLSTNPQVETPQISPNGGEFNQGTALVITTATAGTTIKYRTDGRAPSFFYPGTTYNGPISLNPGSYLFTARGYKDGYYKSDAAYANQLTINPITLPSPVIYPNSGEFNGNVTVYLGSTVLGATIRYTTDGSEPNANSTIFNEPITIENSVNVKAKTYLDGYTPSQTQTASYTIINQAAVPDISPSDGSSANDSMLVTLATSTGGATIRYTTNGAEPTTYSSLYSGPFTLFPGQHTVKAKAFVDGAQPSSSSSANLVVYDTSITVSPPNINPIGGIFNAPVTITMSSDTAGVSLIFYTLDGTDPATSGSVQSYNGPFDLPASANSYFIKARAFLSGTGNSDMSSATFTIVDPTLGQVATPTMTPDSGTYYNTINISVQAPDFSSPFNIRRIYVTRNGDEPVADFSSTGNGASGVYNFNLSSPESVKAIAAQAGWFDSELKTNDYSFKCATPEISEGGTFIDSTNVIITTDTSNANIYYTSDGSEPNDSSQLYNGEFTITQDQVIKAMCTRNNFEHSDVATSVFVINPTAILPVITTQPQNYKLNKCDNATLSVVATGTEVLQYQWFKDGNVIAAANEPELTIIEVNPADSGNYQVLINNDAGSVLSDIATLIVPIFKSSFEIGETNSTCNSNENFNKSNDLNKDLILNNEVSTLNQVLLNHTDSIYGMNGMSNIGDNIHSTEKTENIDSQQIESRGSEPQVIPTLNNWAQYLLFILMLIIALFYQKRTLVVKS